MPVETLSANLLGHFQIRQGETALTPALSPRLRALLAYLLLHHDRILSRQQLAFLFWPDSTDSQARTNLRKMVYRLRKAFPQVDDYLNLDGDTIGLHPGVAVELDVAEFEQRLQDAEAAAGEAQVDHLEAAISLYRGDMLPDIYDDWLLPRREQLRQRYLNALDRLAEQLEVKRAYTAAIRQVRRLLREDPLRESAYRRLMRLQVLSGDVAGALRSYHTCASRLEEELGVEPGAATREAYRRLLDRDTTAPAPIPSSPRRLPLVGREATWQVLLRAWQAVTAGKPRAALISGEAGIGKTRLAEELLTWSRRQGIPALSAACFSTEAPLPLAPVTDWLRSEPVWEALPGLAKRWRREVARVLPELLAADPELEPPRPMTEGWQQQHLFLALAEAITAAGEPLLLFLDDLHWADANTLSWLHFLARQKARHRFLLLVTFRSEEIVPAHPVRAWQQTLARTLPVHRIPLARLDIAATMELATHVVDDRVAEEDAAALFAETEGNPFFTVEMARAGLQRAEAAMPEKIRSLIERRLAQLRTPARELAGLAAASGSRFTFPLLAAASPQPANEVVRALDELWQRQIVRQEGEAEYGFTHEKIREVALGRLGPARRQWWHRRLAEALPQIHPEDTVHGRLAAHWEAAGHPQQAVDHYLQAAHGASRLYAHEETVALLQRALSLLPPGHSARTDAQAQMGEALVALGEHGEAAVAFAQAARETKEAVEKARLLGRRVAALSGQGLFEEASASYREALSFLEGRPAAERSPAWWRTWLGLQFERLDMLYFENNLNGMQQLSQALVEPLEAHGTARQRTQYFAILSKARFLERRYRLMPRDVVLVRQALHWARRTGDESLICHTRFGLGFNLLWAGQVAEAMAELRQVAAQANAWGNIPLQNRCLTYLGIAHRIQGDEAGVREVLAQGEAVTQAEGRPDYLGAAEAQQAWLAWRAGEPAAVARHGRAALNQWQGLQQSNYPFEWLARFPLMAAAVQAPDPAPAAAADARAHARALLAPVQQRLPTPVTGALEAALEAESPADALSHLQTVCRLAQEQGYL